jgi:hypothetical protein
MECRELGFDDVKSLFMFFRLPGRNDEGLEAGRQVKNSFVLGWEAAAGTPVARRPRRTDPGGRFSRIGIFTRTR